MKKDKKVQNGPIGKLFRTIGYLMILLASGFLTLNYIGALNILSSVINPVVTFVNTNLNFMDDYVLLTLVVGVLAVIYPLSKNLGFPIVTTVFILLGVFIFDMGNVSNPILPFLKIDDIDFIANLLIDHIWLKLALLIAPMFLLYLLFGFKRPKRWASSLLSATMILSLVALVLMHLPLFLGNDWNTLNWYMAIYNGAFAFSFLLSTLAGAFGVIGFMRK